MTSMKRREHSFIRKNEYLKKIIKVNKLLKHSETKKSVKILHNHQQRKVRKVYRTNKMLREDSDLI